MTTIGDETFLAGDTIGRIGCLLDPGLRKVEETACPGFAQRQRGDMPAGGDRPQITLALFGRGIGRDDGSPDAVHAETDGRGWAGTAQSLAGGQQSTACQTQSTPLGRHGQARQTGTLECLKGFLGPAAFRIGAGRHGPDDVGCYGLRLLAGLIQGGVHVTLCSGVRTAL